jgi:hypothetical protein
MPSTAIAADRTNERRYVPSSCLLSIQKDGSRETVKLRNRYTSANSTHFRSLRENPGANRYSS